MHAVLIKNKELVWSQVADPVRKPHEVIIDVRAAALNRADLMQVDGNYPPPPGWPEWPGLEVAGVIAEAPANSRWQVGQQVCALLGGGGYAQKAAVPANMVLPLPANLSMAEGAAIPEVFATAYLNLVLEAGLKAGDTVFIQAGASGLGSAAIQLAKFFGAKVVTSVGSDEKAAFARQLGADVVINYKEQKIAEVLRLHPVDIALDCVAGPELGACLSTMARGGRWIVIATLAGGRCELDMTDFFKRGVRLIGSTLRSRTDEVKGNILSALEAKLWPAFADGRLKVMIHQTLPMTAADEAHQILRRDRNLGKVVLTV